MKSERSAVFGLSQAASAPVNLRAETASRCFADTPSSVFTRRPHPAASRPRLLPEEKRPHRPLSPCLTTRVQLESACGRTPCRARASPCRSRPIQPIGRLRRQKQVVDANAVVLLPGARLIVPERIEAARVASSRAARRSSRAPGVRGTSRAFAAGTARHWPSFGMGGVARLRNDVEIAGQDQRLFESISFARVADQPVHEGELIRVFLGAGRDCRSADRCWPPARRRRRPGSPPRHSATARHSRSPGRPRATSNGRLERMATPLNVFWPWVSML